MQPQFKVLFNGFKSLLASVSHRTKTFSSNENRSSIVQY